MELRTKEDGEDERMDEDDENRRVVRYVHCPLACRLDPL